MNGAPAPPPPGGTFLTGDGAEGQGEGARDGASGAGGAAGCVTLKQGASAPVSPGPRAGGRFFAARAAPFDPSGPTRLPEAVDEERLMTVAAAAVHLRSAAQRRAWGNAFRSERAKLVVRDAFWFTMQFEASRQPLTRHVHESHAATRRSRTARGAPGWRAHGLPPLSTAPFEQRLAHNVIALEMAAPSRDRDAIRLALPQAILRAVLLGIYVAFPDGRAHLDDAVRDRVQRQCWRWFLGKDPTSREWEGILNEKDTTAVQPGAGPLDVERREREALAKQGERRQLDQAFDAVIRGRGTSSPRLLRAYGLAPKPRPRHAVLAVIAARRTVTFGHRAAAAPGATEKAPVQAWHRRTGLTGASTSTPALGVRPRVASDSALDARRVVQALPAGGSTRTKGGAPTSAPAMDAFGATAPPRPRPAEAAVTTSCGVAAYERSSTARWQSRRRRAHNSRPRVPDGGFLPLVRPRLAARQPAREFATSGLARALTGGARDPANHFVMRLTQPTVPEELGVDETPEEDLPALQRSYAPRARRGARSPATVRGEGTEYGPAQAEAAAGGEKGDLQAQSDPTDRPTTYAQVAQASARTHSELASSYRRARHEVLKDVNEIEAQASSDLEALRERHRRTLQDPEAVNTTSNFIMLYMENLKTSRLSRPSISAIGMLQ